MIKNAIYDTINDFYRKNPPEMVLDDQGVKHIVEVLLPSQYVLNPCDCGIVHPVDSETWYHSGIKISENEEECIIAVYRACKTCNMVLMRKLVKPTL